MYILFLMLRGCLAADKEIQSRRMNAGFPMHGEKVQSVPRQPDGNGFYLHCTGGFRAGQIAENAWKIEPLLIDKIPCAKGFMTREEIHKFIYQNNLKPIAFHEFGWSDGEYHSNWAPIIPEKKNHMRSAADLWGSISSNISHRRLGDNLGGMENPTYEKIRALIDQKSEVESLANSISLSLRSMDISVEQIVDFYNEKLVDLMASGKISGQRVSTSLDQALFANVHSFFLHIGAARDYLGAFIALRLGKDPQKVDSMARLMNHLLPENFDADRILKLFRSRGFIRQSSSGSNNWSTSGWLKEVTDLRNQFVHKRPYGAKLSEAMGYAEAINLDLGLFRYVRPVVISSDHEEDILDIIADHYKNSSKIFYDAAEVSDLDTGILALTDKDIISIEIRH